MDRVLDFVREHRLLLIEDCAQAHGAHWNGRRVGSKFPGDVAAFSFTLPKYDYRGRRNGDDKQC